MQVEKIGQMKRVIDDIEETPIVEPKVEEETQSQGPPPSQNQNQNQNRDYNNRARGGNDRGGRGEGRGRGNNGRGEGRGRGDRPQRERNTKPPAHGPFKAFMSNLAFKVTEALIYEFFSENCPATNVTLRMERENPTKFDGSAIITFESSEHLVKSMDAQGHELSGRNVHIRVYEDFSDRGNRNGGRRDDRPEEKSWNRGASAGRGDREERGGRGRGERGDRRDRNEAPSSAPSTSSGSSTRPKLDLKPRTITSDGANTNTNNASSIFGEGKARVEDESSTSTKEATTTTTTTTATGDKTDMEKSDKTTDKTEKTDRYVAKAPREHREKKDGKGVQTTSVFNKAMKVSVECIYVCICMVCVVYIGVCISIHIYIRMCTHPKSMLMLIK